MFQLRIHCASAVLIWAACVAAQAQTPMPSDSQRALAAKATVKNNAYCSKTALKSFYWEIGDVNGPLVSGIVGTSLDADTAINIASASKWLYGAYVVEKYGDVAANVPFLNLSSGYSNFDTTACPDDGTVAACNPGPINLEESLNGIHHYDGGHMQRHAIDIGLGALKARGFTREIQSMIGADIDVSYTKPQPAGGAKISSRAYANFMRKMLVGHPTPLKLGPLLGAHAVCTRPSSECVAADFLKVPEAWHYALGHWVEDDPAFTPSSNFAYSSSGIYGFYPWVDVERKLYGVLARKGPNSVENEPYASVQCGRLIRLAWKTGVAQ